MKNIIDRVKALWNLPGFHTKTGDKPMTNFELVTAMLSVIAYQTRIGKMTLFTDFEGEEWAKRTGLIKLYDDHRIIHVHTAINRNVFWAAGKLYAMNQMKAPCVSVDLDAVLFDRPSLISDVVALHPEPYEWDVYSYGDFRNIVEDEARLRGVCQDRDPMLSNNPPANVGILAINDEGFRSEYADAAIWMMIQESVNPVTDPKSVIRVDGTPVTQMVLAEQYFLSVLAYEMEKRLSFITDLNVGLQHMVPTPKAVHLWNSKRYYAKHGRAREAYISWALNQIYALTEKDEMIHGILRDNGLPTVRVLDGNTGATRWSYKGEWEGPGDIIGGFGDAD